MSHPMELYDECMALQRSGKTSEAIEALNTLTQQHPEFALSYNALAAFYKKQGNIAQAVANAEEYCRHAPEDAFGYSILSSYCLEAGMREKAEDALAKAYDLRFKAQFAEPPAEEES